MIASAPALAVDDLRVAYGAVEALHGVSLTVPQGQVTCIMGRNGVGKTTLLRAIVGTLRSRSGSVRLFGQELVRLAPPRRARAGLGLVPQGREIFPRLTVEENLRVGLEARADRSRRIPEEVLDLFPILRQFLRRMGGDLSGGQQQQLAIARALVGDPKVLLLDEPTEGIQPNVIDLIGDVLRRLVRERGITVVLVEQYLDFVRRVGDRFYLMNRGVMVAEGETAALSDELVGEHLSV